MAQKVIIFVPGYLCSKLIRVGSKEVVWPDMVVGSSDDNVSQLLEERDLFPGGPVLMIDKCVSDQSAPKDASSMSMMCGDLVGFLIQYFDCIYTYERENLPKTTMNVLIGFGYDWRSDIRESAHSLKLLIDNAYQTYGPKSDIWLISHSMGPLICRYLIESGISKDVGWTLKGFISLGGAHIGAPFNLNVISGLIGQVYQMNPQQLKSLVFIEPDKMQILSNWPKHPSVYQMLPPEQITCVKQGTEDLSIYNPTSPIYQLLVAPSPAGFGASSENLAIAKEFYTKLDYSAEQGQRTDYYVVYGSGVSTAEMFEYDQDAKTLQTIIGDGDGTVPTYSARFDGGWVKESFNAPSILHGALLSNPSVLAQIWRWMR